MHTKGRNEAHVVKFGKSRAICTCSKRILAAWA